MDINLPIFLLANFYINAAIGFGISLIIVEFSIFIFQLKRPRSIMILRLLPFFKIVWDVIFNYTPVSWAVSNGIDIVNRVPMSMAMVFNAGFQNMLPFVSFRFSIYRHFSVSPADLLTQNIGALPSAILVFLLTSGSIAFLVITVWKLIRSSREVERIVRVSSRIFDCSDNETLAKAIRQSEIFVYLTSADGIGPFSTGFFKRRIVIPTSLWLTMSSGERDAVLAHELSHLKWNDALTRIVLQFWIAVFWFLPFCRTYAARMDDLRERSCDLSCGRFVIPLTDMASAIAETLSYSARMPVPATAAALSGRKKASAMDRICFLLGGEGENFEKRRLAPAILNAVLVMVISVFILNSRFGTF
jgi:beta-lactamase regulating signal transducer with metallopeptidase domain